MYICIQCACNLAIVIQTLFLGLDAVHPPLGPLRIELDAILVRWKEFERKR